MISTDPIIAACVARVAPALSPVPVGHVAPPDAPEAVVVEYGPGTTRPGSMAKVAEDVWLRLRIRGVASGPGASRRSMHLAEQAAAVLIGARLAGDGWEAIGWEHIADMPDIGDGGDLVNAVVDLTVQVTAGPASPADP